MNQSRFYNSDRHDRSLQSTPSRQYSGTPESSPLSISSETPSSSHSRHNAMASNISLVQDQLNTILRKLDQTNERLDNLTERIEKIEKDTSEDNVEAQKNTKRKRTKDSLTVQEKVHNIHAKREERKQYKGLESVLSPHNKEVTAFIVKQLKSEGFDEVKVQRASKKYHEHIRRVAQGKINDDIKNRMKLSNRKARKYNQRKSCINEKKEREVKAFELLSKDHMSSDEDDPGNPKQWISRPPTYRSEKLQMFINKLDKVHERRSLKDPKYTKRITRVVGNAKEMDPPNSTPLWAISEEWTRQRQDMQESNIDDENGEIEPNEEQEEEEDGIESDSEMEFEL